MASYRALALVPRCLSPHSLLSRASLTTSPSTQLPSRPTLTAQTKRAFSTTPAESTPVAPVSATQATPSISLTSVPKKDKVVIDPSMYGTRPHPTDPAEPLLGPLRSYKVFLTEGQKVLWCQCGHSKTPPFCDGAHKALPHPFKPIVFEATEAKLYGFCLCRYAKTPICDGTHKLFEGWTKPAVKLVQNNPVPPAFDAALI